MENRNYTIKSAQRRDEWQSRYGTMVDYALALDGVDGWVKLSQKLETPEPQNGGTIYGHITDETTKNGNPYKKFKKENPDYEGNRSQNNQNSQANHQIDYIVQMLEELTGRRAAYEGTPPDQGLDIDDPFGDL